MMYASAKQTIVLLRVEDVALDEEMFQGPRNRTSRIDAAMQSAGNVTNFSFDAAAHTHLSRP